ncbi:hypothetical protein BJ742DRAFT_835951 [Cladochytrium replicatum]|nr:hypothetical protein BJ742DRAFT_835951 [Cladochytrium replicatum]
MYLRNPMKAVELDMNLGHALVRRANYSETTRQCSRDSDCNNKFPFCSNNTQTCVDLRDPGWVGCYRDVDCYGTDTKSRFCNTPNVPHSGGYPYSCSSLLEKNSKCWRNEMCITGQCSDEGVCSENVPPTLTIALIASVMAVLCVAFMGAFLFVHYRQRKFHVDDPFELPPPYGASRANSSASRRGSRAGSRAANRSGPPSYISRRSPRNSQVISVADLSAAGIELSSGDSRNAPHDSRTVSDISSESGSVVIRQDLQTGALTARRRTGSGSSHDMWHIPRPNINIPTAAEAAAAAAASAGGNHTNRPSGGSNIEMRALRRSNRTPSPRSRTSTSSLSSSNSSPGRGTSNGFGTSSQPPATSTSWFSSFSSILPRPRGQSASAAAQAAAQAAAAVTAADVAAEMAEASAATRRRNSVPQYLEDEHDGRAAMRDRSGSSLTGLPPKLGPHMRGLHTSGGGPQRRRSDTMKSPTTDSDSAGETSSRTKTGTSSSSGRGSKQSVKFTDQDSVIEGSTSRLETLEPREETASKSVGEFAEKIIDVVITEAPNTTRSEQLATPHILPLMDETKRAELLRMGSISSLSSYESAADSFHSAQGPSGGDLFGTASFDNERVDDLGAGEVEDLKTAMAASLSTFKAKGRATTPPPRDIPKTPTHPHPEGPSSSSSAMRRRSSHEIDSDDDVVSDEDLEAAAFEMERAGRERLGDAMRRTQGAVGMEGGGSGSGSTPAGGSTAAAADAAVVAALARGRGRGGLVPPPPGASGNIRGSSAGVLGVARGRQRSSEGKQPPAPGMINRRQG